MLAVIALKKLRRRFMGSCCWFWWVIAPLVPLGAKAPIPVKCWRYCCWLVAELRRFLSLERPLLLPLPPLLLLLPLPPLWSYMLSPAMLLTKEDRRLVMALVLVLLVVQLDLTLAPPTLPARPIRFLVPRPPTPPPPVPPPEFSAELALVDALARLLLRFF
ncbi:MAG: hypothetical protein J3R72DRAFT_441199 [Linnemannia gamsii]|nr:MAG: hypothetical protein J3R72DRAFT_441199 [Linnemannia gamsii]